MKIGDKVTLKKGTSVGMGQLKADTPAKIIRTDQATDGVAIYCAEWYDYKGNRRTTWIRG